MRDTKVKFGVLAMVMVIGMIGIVAALDSIPTLGLLGMAVLFFACAVVLLFCLMKLEVMEFQKGSFWYEVNMQVNAPKQRAVVVRNRNYAGNAVRTPALAKGV